MGTKADPTSLHELHRVVVHVVARARLEATGRFSLRVTNGGLGTPEFGRDSRRVRLTGSTLIVDSDRLGAPSIRSIAIDGATLGTLAEFAGVDLGRPLDVGHDTPPLGDVDAPLALDASASEAICGWYAVAGRALDAVATALPAEALPTLPRLWPEHLDVALDAVARPGVRVNLGASPGDGFCSEPYLYVGPWTDDRPGDAAFWNAPFGAFLHATDLAGDRAVACAEFWLDGLRRLA